jgi:hypothetical protein
VQRIWGRGSPGTQPSALPTPSWPFPPHTCLSPPECLLSPALVHTRPAQTATFPNLLPRGWLRKHWEAGVLPQGQ